MKSEIKSLRAKQRWSDPEYRKRMSLSHIGKTQTHGFSKTNFYKLWENINQRCLNEKSHNYKNYGGRGISVEWKSFIEFKDGMYESYLEAKKTNKRAEIDRIDNNGNYSTSNCRWVSRVDNCLNQRKTRHIALREVRIVFENIFKVGSETVRFNIQEKGVIAGLQHAFERRIKMEIDKALLTQRKAIEEAVKKLQVYGLIGTKDYLLKRKVLSIIEETK